MNQLKEAEKKASQLVQDARKGAYLLRVADCLTTNLSPPSYPLMSRQRASTA